MRLGSVSQSVSQSIDEEPRAEKWQAHGKRVRNYTKPQDPCKPPRAMSCNCGSIPACRGLRALPSPFQAPMQSQMRVRRPFTALENSSTKSLLLFSKMECGIAGKFLVCTYTSVCTWCVILLASKRSGAAVTTSVCPRINLHFSDA